MVFLDEMFGKCFPCENREFNTNFVRLYLNLFDTSIETNFQNLVLLDMIQHKTTSEKFLQTYFEESPVLSEVNFSQQILAERHLERMLLEKSQHRVSFTGIWKRLKSLISRSETGRSSKLALLDFDIDFLLDLLLFRVK